MAAVHDATVAPVGNRDRITGDPVHTRSSELNIGRNILFLDADQIET